MQRDAKKRTKPCRGSHHAAGRRPDLPRSPKGDRRLPPVQTHRAICRKATNEVAPDAAARHCHSARHARDAGGTYFATIPDAGAKELSSQTPEAINQAHTASSMPRGNHSTAIACPASVSRARRIAPGHASDEGHTMTAGGAYSRTRLRAERRRANHASRPGGTAPAAAETPGTSGQEAGQNGTAHQLPRAGFHLFRDAAHGRPAGGHPRAATHIIGAACHPTPQENATCATC